MKQTLDGDARAGQGAVLLPPGQGGSLAGGGLGGCRSLSCLSVPLPALPQAAILQQTAEYIFSLEQEKTRLLQQNTQLKRFIQVAPACAPRDEMGGDGTVLAGRGGDIVAVPWGRGETLCPNKLGGGDVSHPPGQGRGALFNPASLTWQEEKGWGPIFHLGYRGTAWWQLRL